MAKKGSYRKKLDWIVSVIVMASVALLVLASSYQDGSLGTVLSELKNSVIRELWADVPTPAENPPTDGAAAEASLRVHFIDVGQGKAILVEAPEKNVLIDAGENNQGETVLRYLARQEIKKLDIAIGTHPHSDHIGGLDTVILAAPVDKVVLPVVSDKLSPTSPTYMDLLNAIASKDLKITPARPGDEYGLGGGAALKILGPVRNDYASLNDFSIVSRLDYGSTSFLFTADATSVAEKDLLDSGAKLRANALDVGHHGSRDSSSKAFLEAINPQIAVISCGLDNSYGHPHRQAMTRIEAFNNIEILRTDLDGSIILSSNGKEIVYNNPASK